jgi:hypothetical protein
VGTRCGAGQLQVADVRASQEPYQHQRDGDQAEQDENHAPARVGEKRGAGDDDAARVRAFFGMEAAQEQIDFGADLFP